MQVKAFKSFAKNVSASLSESLSASSSLSLVFRAEFSLSKASTGPDLVERSVDRLNDSKFNFRSLMSSQTELSLALISKAYKSCELDITEPSVPEAKLLTGTVTCVEETIKLVISVSFGGFSIRKSSSLLPSASKQLAERSLSISLLPSRLVAMLALTHFNPVLRSKWSLRIVSCNITFIIFAKGFMTGIGVESGGISYDVYLNKTFSVYFRR